MTAAYLGPPFGAAGASTAPCQPHQRRTLRFWPWERHVGFAAVHAWKLRTLAPVHGRLCVGCTRYQSINRTKKRTNRQTKKQKTNKQASKQSHIGCSDLALQPRDPLLRRCENLDLGPLALVEPAVARSDASVRFDVPKDHRRMPRRSGHEPQIKSAGSKRSKRSG